MGTHWTQTVSTGASIVLAASLLTAAGTGVAQTAGAGAEVPAAGSNQIVFISDRAPGLGSFAVAVMNGDGSDQHLLTGPEPRAVDPVWLPGGKQIAFESVASPGDWEVYGGVWSIRADGTHLRWLLRERVSRQSPDPAWSDGGRRMAFVRGSGLYVARPDGSKAHPVFWAARPLARPTWSPNGRRLAVVSGGQILVLRLGSARARLLFRTRPQADAYEPSWSPNGRKIGFIAVSRRGASGLYVVNADGRHERQLADNVGYGFLDTGRPSWSPDSTELVVARTSRSGRAAGLAVVDVRTAHRRRISGNGSAPQWSPNGRWIAYTATVGGSGRIYLVRPDGSRRRLLVPFGYSAQFSPDGRKLAILASGSGFAPISGAGGAIYVVNTDGSHVRKLTHPFDDLAAVGSPDHKKVAFVRSVPGDPRTGQPASRAVYIVDADGRGLRRIASGDSVAWAPDSLRVVFAESGDIYSAPAVGGSVRQLTSGPATDSAPAWSPDGKTIAFSRTLTASSMWDICLVNAASPGPVSCLSAAGANPAWSPDGSLIAFTVGDRADPESSGIGVIGADGSGRRVLGQGYAPAWAPDGRRLAFIDLSASSDGQLAVVGSDGSGLTRFPEPVLPEPPTWSADGSRIVLASCPPQIYDCEIWSAPLTGSPARALTTNLIDDIAPVSWR